MIPELFNEDTKFHAHKKKGVAIDYDACDKEVCDIIKQRVKLNLKTADWAKYYLCRCLLSKKKREQAKQFHNGVDSL